MPTMVPSSASAMNRSVAGEATTSPSSTSEGGGFDRESWGTSLSTASTIAGVSDVAISTFIAGKLAGPRPVHAPTAVQTRSFRPEVPARAAAGPRSGPTAG
jgi:hypothetical protein